MEDSKKVPLEESKSKNENEFEQKELDELEEDILNPRNFHNNLYQNDNFQQIKEYLFKDLYDKKAVIKESKNYIDEETKDCIDDLNLWKANRIKDQMQKRREQEEFQKRYERELDSILKSKPLIMLAECV